MVAAKLHREAAGRRAGLPARVQAAVGRLEARGGHGLRYIITRTANIESVIVRVRVMTSTFQTAPSTAVVVRGQLRAHGRHRTSASTSSLCGWFQRKKPHILLAAVPINQDETAITAFIVTQEGGTLPTPPRG